MRFLQERIILWVMENMVQFKAGGTLQHVALQSRNRSNVSNRNKPDSESRLLVLKEQILDFSVFGCLGEKFKGRFVFEIKSGCRIQKILLPSE